jgi:hypothetical protein
MIDGKRKEVSLESFGDEQCPLARGTRGLQGIVGECLIWLSPCIERWTLRPSTSDNVIVCLANQTQKLRLTPTIPSPKSTIHTFNSYLNTSFSTIFPPTSPSVQPFPPIQLLFYPLAELLDFYTSIFGVLKNTKIFEVLWYTLLSTN